MQGQSRPFIATKFPESPQEVHKQSYLLLSKSNWKDNTYTSSWSTRLDECFAYAAKWRILSMFSSVGKNVFHSHDHKFVYNGGSKKCGGANHPRPNFHVNDGPVWKILDSPLLMMDKLLIGSNFVPIAEKRDVAAKRHPVPPSPFRSNPIFRKKSRQIIGFDPNSKVGVPIWEFLDPPAVTNSRIAFFADISCSYSKLPAGDSLQFVTSVH